MEENNNLVQLQDENGNDVNFEHLMTVEHEGSYYVLLEATEDMDDCQQGEAIILKIIRDEVLRLSRLVASLLDISRIQAGDRKFVMEPFDICEMGRQVLISFEQKIDKKRLEVEFICDDDNMFVTGDHDAIYQIFYNITDNAVKFAFEGGLLRISLTRVEKNKVRISVYNEGDGIPYDDQPYIFERFYKSDRSRGKDKTGVGLGMFIAKTIIEAHKEVIALESEPGKYCEFYFTLPITPEDKKPQKSRE